ncbi:MAG: winged helix-turn-helix transcriptional regulator [Clostridiales bacterium]|nr:winged helix-turn-helix transcriptional regulator [Clostridiales bacterium]
MKFFNPTSELKELLLLQHIEVKADTTQSEIASVIGGAASMVNVYIDRLENDGYLKRNYKSSKIVFYNITPEGIKRKNYLLINYMKELLDLYQLAKENVESFLLHIESKGFSNIILYGAGEVAETILGVIRDRGQDSLNVLAIIDDNKVLYGKKILDYKIISKEDIGKYKVDGIVVASYAYEEKILEKLKEIGYPQEKIIRFFNY